MKPGGVPVAENWFARSDLGNGLTLLEEPYVHPVLSANTWWLKGRDRDLVFDAGLGVASLRDEAPDLFVHEPLLVLSHAHLDHMGGAHEFDDRQGHAGEGDAYSSPRPVSLFGAVLAEQMGATPGQISLEDPTPETPRGERLISARPSVGYDMESYALRPAPLTRLLQDGDELDLGNRILRVLHLPGHTPGSVVLFDDADGSLFAGDVVYDGPIFDELPDSDIPAYLESLRRLRELPVTTVYPGHGPVFDGDRLEELIDDYLARRSSWAEPAPKDEEAE